MRRCIILVGISASGKTTWANKYMRPTWEEEKNHDDRIYTFSRDNFRHLLATVRESSKNGLRYYPEYQTGYHQGHIFIDNEVTNIWNVWDLNLEREISQLMFTEVSRILACQRDIIIDNTNVKVNDALPWINKAKNAGYTPYLKFFPIDIEEAIARDLKRPDPIGENAIYRQHNHWLRSWGKRICIIDGKIVPINLPCRWLLEE